MDHRRLFIVTLITLVITGKESRPAAQKRLVDIRRVVSGLDTSEQGAVRWLDALTKGANDFSAERLLAVTMTGERLLAREGARSLVVVGSELDRLLRRPDQSIVLIHNHPSNVSLSAADLGQLAKPGIAAIAAIGHDLSIFIAARGARMDPIGFEEEQYVLAQSEVKRRLRAAGPGHVLATDSDAQFTHLVARVLERAGIIQYRSVLRGTNRTMYDGARLIFGQVVEGAAARVKQQR